MGPAGSGCPPERRIGPVSDDFAPRGFGNIGSLWVLDGRGRLEDAGLVPRLADPGKAKKRMAGSTRTDAHDAAGLAMLLSELWGIERMVSRLRS